MSSPGQAFGAVAGATIGFFIGGPTGAAYGFQIGLMAGSALFPTQLPTLQGPRIEDIASTTSQVGAPIPQGYGTFPAVGNIIWQSDLREVVTSDEVGGKGGSEQSVETATYYQDFAIGLNDGAIVGIRRIWANGKLIYDVSPQAAGESQEEYDARVTANLALDEIMTIYKGTETQLPDPTIETALGVGNISAFRGLAYVVFTGWQNKPEDGMRMPAAWKFELAAGELFATDLLYPWSTSVDPRDVRNQHKYRAQMQINTNTWGSIRTSLDAALADTPASFGVPRNTPLAWSCNAAYERSTSAVGPWMQSEVNEFNAVPDHHQLLNMVMWFNSREVTNQLDTLLEAAQVSDLADCAQHDAVGSSVGAENSTVWWIGFKQFDRLSGLEHGVYGKTLSGAHPADTTLLAEFCPPPPDDETVLFAVRDVAVVVERVPTPPPGYVLDTARDYHMLRKYAGCAFVTAAGRCAASFPLGPARPDDHPEFSDQTFWEAAYTAAVARGEMAEGLIYGTHYPQLQDYGYVVPGGEILPASLAKIVRDICADTGLTDVDVSDLEDQYITGYVRTRVMPARAAIEPLSQVGFFDKIESGAVVRFPVRGKALVDTLLEDELGAHIAGSERPSAITTRKLQDVELPRQIRVHYLANSRDYEPGEQSSPVRTGTEAINEIDIELAVCIDDERAARIAEVLWADAWASRHAHQTTVDQSQLALEPADNIGVPVDGRVERMRIISIDDTPPSLRRLELLRDDDGAYVSEATAAVPIFTPPLIALPTSPVELVLLDLPVLRDADNEAGFYAAVRPSGTTFKGAAILRSADGGGSYQQVGASGTAVTMGLLATAPAASDATTRWNRASTFDVTLDYGTLESRTEAEVLSGANAAAIGADGRWEIVQFRDAVLQSGTTWRLTGLLRGRRGSEHFVGDALVGDRFVLLSKGGLIRIPQDIASIGAERLYKAVGKGGTVDSAAAQAFTGRALALKPFASVHVAGSRDGSDNLTISWVRRGRLGQELPDGADIPLSEETESYDVEILSGAAVLRTISVSTQQASYTAAQQSTDFGSAQAAIDVRIFQRSAVLGRGTPTEATV